MAVEPAFIVRPEHCARLIGVAQQIGSPARVPLYRAVADGQVTLIEHGRDRHVTWAMLSKKHGPTVILLGDDDYKSTGPSGWPQAVCLLRWARTIILHGANGEPVHYAMAAAGAMIRRRLLMVETDAAHLEAWQVLARVVVPPDTPVGVIRMTPGLSHPRQIALTGATVQ
jgi:hypothetical protein